MVLASVCIVTVAILLLVDILRINQLMHGVSYHAEGVWKSQEISKKDQQILSSMSISVILYGFMLKDYR